MIDGNVLILAQINIYTLHLFVAMTDIIDIFNQYLSQYDSIDIAESEFKKSIHENPDLREAYREWCHEVGSTEKRGFYDYAEEYLDSQDDVWNTLTDIDE